MVAPVDVHVSRERELHPQHGREDPTPSGPRSTKSPLKMMRCFGRRPAVRPMTAFKSPNEPWRSPTMVSDSLTFNSFDDGFAPQQLRARPQNAAKVFSPKAAILVGRLLQRPRSSFPNCPRPPLPRAARVRPPVSKASAARRRRRRCPAPSPRILNRRPSATLGRLDGVHGREGGVEARRRRPGGAGRLRGAA